MVTEMMQAESLSRAIGGRSTMNYGPIFEGFAAKGIPMSDVEPRVNVFTYWAWRAKGRQVRKGEKGVHVVTFVPFDDKVDKATGKVLRKGGARPRGATVFHVSQTEPAAD